MERKIEKLKEFEKLVQKEFVGKEETVEALLVCLLAGGHALLEDVPGIGKTTLAKAFSTVAGLQFGRIQFTPDTLPGDVVGISVYQLQTGDFTWKPGVVMNQILLADEINRTPPKTQSSLLEAMGEEQITVDGKTMKLPKPFMVLATQNPVEYMGTYPLPEAQLDRFMMKLSLGYPEREQELEIIRKRLHNEEQSEEVHAVFSVEEILNMKAEVCEVKLTKEMLEYAQNIVHMTREDERVRLGGSTRALLALIKAAQAKAYLDGREYVKPDDIKKYAISVLAHRLVLSSKARRENHTAEHIIRELLTKVRVPV